MNMIPCSHRPKVHLCQLNKYKVLLPGSTDFLDVTTLQYSLTTQCTFHALQKGQQESGSLTIQTAFFRVMHDLSLCKVLLYFFTPQLKIPMEALLVLRQYHLNYSKCKIFLSVNKTLLQALFGECYSQGGVSSCYWTETLLHHSQSSIRCQLEWQTRATFCPTKMLRLQCKIEKCTGKIYTTRNKLEVKVILVLWNQKNLLNTRVSNI